MSSRGAGLRVGHLGQLEALVRRPTSIASSAQWNIYDHLGTAHTGRRLPTPTSSNTARNWFSNVSQGMQLARHSVGDYFSTS